MGLLLPVAAQVPPWKSSYICWYQQKSPHRRAHAGAVGALPRLYPLEGDSSLAEKLTCRPLPKLRAPWWRARPTKASWNDQRHPLTEIVETALPSYRSAD